MVERLIIPQSARCLSDRHTYIQSARLVEFTPRQSSKVDDHSLTKNTNWWGAFAIGLAGTILVIGLVGYALVALGGVAVLLFIGLTLIGVFLCACLAELAAAFPDKAGGLPSYAFETFKPFGPVVAKHAGGLSVWAYWLGWCPVAPINALLAAQYIVDLFDIPDGGTFGPIASNFGSAVSVSVLLTATCIIFVVFIPCWFGIKLGEIFATVMGISSMAALVMVIFLPLFHPSSISFENVQILMLPDGVQGTWQLIAGWMFIFSWSVWGMEAAACYISECQEPARDAAIAMTLSGLFGLFVYVALPIMILAVLGNAGLHALDTPGDAYIVFNGYIKAIFGSSPGWTWFVGLSLIFNLVLSVLNALNGASRGLWQASVDGVLPSAFSCTNAYGSPAAGILASVFLSLLVLMVGDPLQIYIISNMGYLFALSVSMVGYGVFRLNCDDMVRPIKLARCMGPCALAIGSAGMILWMVGGFVASDIAVGEGYRWLFGVGLGALLLYLPIHAVRRLEDAEYCAVSDDQCEDESCDDDASSVTENTMLSTKDAIVEALRIDSARL